MLNMVPFESFQKDKSEKVLGKQRNHFMKLQINNQLTPMVRNTKDLEVQKIIEQRSALISLT